MVIIEQKRLVAIKLMKWKYEGHPFKDSWSKGEYLGKVLFTFGLDDWNPQDNEKATCKEWNEIWESMSARQWEIFVDKLWPLLKIGAQFEIKIYKKLITAKPEIYWEALIKTLEGK